MLSGFLMGVASALCWFGGVLLLVIWVASGFYSPAAPIIAVILFVVGAFLAYVSRQTVRVRH